VVRDQGSCLREADFGHRDIPRPSRHSESRYWRITLPQCWRLCCVLGLKRGGMVRFYLMRLTRIVSSSPSTFIRQPALVS
jgi:hypothetical protein